MPAALGITRDGKKLVLGVWQGSAENVRVSEDLIDDFLERGLGTDRRLLFVADAAKALSKPRKATFGKAAEIQRCPIHKERNVPSCLSRADQTAARRRARNAWGLKRHEDAEAALKAAAGLLRAERDFRRRNASTYLESLVPPPRRRASPRRRRRVPL